MAYSDFYNKNKNNNNTQSSNTNTGARWRNQRNTNAVNNGVQRLVDSSNRNINAVFNQMGGLLGNALNSGKGDTGNGGRNGSNGGGGSITPNYDKQMRLLKKASQMRLNNQLGSLKNSLQSLMNSYQSSQNQLNSQYRTDVGQSEVERYKAQRALRESLANRGAMDSGAGRQENLNTSNTFANQLAALKSAYNTNMNDLRNNANASVSELDAAYQNALEEINSNILGQQSDYIAKGWNPSKDYTLSDTEWANYLNQLKEQYGL